MMYSEEEYGKKIFTMLNKLTIKRKKQFISDTLKDLKAQGRTNEWVYTALSSKDPANWDKWGFGLMFNEKYIAYVNKSVNCNKTDDDDLLELFSSLTGTTIKAEEEIDYV